MDANGTRYQLILGNGDWFPPGVTSDPNLAWDASGNEVTLQPRLFHFAVPPGQSGPTLDQRRGAGRDRFGNWYWIGPNRDEILVNSADSGLTTHFWGVSDISSCPPSPSAFQPLDSETPLVGATLSGLAVTDEHRLVAGAVNPPGLLVFDLQAGGPPVLIRWPVAVPFVPFDMSPAPGGAVAVLDRQHACFWILDRRLQPLSNDPAASAPFPGPNDPFQPLDGSSVRQTFLQNLPAGVTLDMGDAIAIEALPDGTILILSNPPKSTFAEVSRFNLGGMLGKPASTSVMLNVIEPSSATGFQLVGYDFAFAPASKSQAGDRIDVVSSDGEQVYAFTIALDANGQLTLNPIAEYLPMRRFGAKGLVTAPPRYGGTGLDATSAPYYDFGIGWVPLIAQRRPRYVSGATIQTRPFDGHAPACVWHRLMLDACIPPETAVQVSSRSSDDLQDLAATPWRAEPALYLRDDGTELPYAPPTVTGGAGAGTWELLFQQAQGRYLQLQLQLVGNGRATPKLRALRAYYPRFSYLDRYLPAVYREDDQSASFLDRFLANFEGFFTTLEGKIAAVEALFDVRGAPAADLNWLASWFGVALDPNWEEARRRLFLAHAMDFFQYRGTIRGLVMALRLVFDTCPTESIFTDPSTSCSATTRYRIVETYATRTLPSVVLGDPTGASTVAPGGRWQVSQGRAVLNALYATAAGLTGPVEFPIQPPAEATTKAVWQQFAQQALGFVPSAGPADLGRWQGFIERRYQSLSAYNTAYGLTGAGAALSFAAIALPVRLPPDGPPLVDWYQFESTVLGRLRTAHRFRVLIPAPATDDAAESQHQQRFDLASRVIDLEKPAHTVYDVRFYWAYFQAGYARLGCDTLVDRGGRSPQLMTPVILGRGDLAASYLTPALPGERARRWFLGEKGLRE